MTAPPTWPVLLIGGPSGVGKTSVSYRLARYFGAGLTEVDDLFIVAEQLTTPEGHPALHYWRTHPEAAQDPAERVVEQLIAVGETLKPALVAVVANHVETRTPLVLEGDFVLPSLVAHPRLAHPGWASGVRGVFLFDEEAGLLQNFGAREPGAVVQSKRARVSYLYGQWLKEEAERYGLVSLAARPWETVLDRIIRGLT